MLPQRYRWLERESGPRMIVETLKEHGTVEAPGAADNPRILRWQKELQSAGFGRGYGSFYRADSIPWCGLFMAVIAHRANLERRPERNPPKLYLAALQWADWGSSVAQSNAGLGDVLVFKRSGGGHVGLYVGHDDHAFHVLGGNQANRVSITRIARSRLHAVRRPAYRLAPTNIRPIRISATGALSSNEA
jgi:uncharacterized protein (TIGR02594 family)